MGTASRPKDARFSSSCPDVAPAPEVTGIVCRSCEEPNSVGRHLDHQRIAHAVARIDPEIRRRLRARIGGHQHIVGGLLLRHARLASPTRGPCRR